MQSMSSRPGVGPKNPDDGSNPLGTTAPFLARPVIDVSRGGYTAMSIQTNPFEEFERLLERVGRQLEEMSRTWDRDEPFELWSGLGKRMAMDLVEHDDELVLNVDIPGFERNDVDVRVSDHTLTVSAEREEEKEEGEASYLRRERSQRSVRRSIQLPMEVDVDRVSARMKHGVLTVSMPKEETSKAKKISIE